MKKNLYSAIVLIATLFCTKTLAQTSASFLSNANIQCLSSNQFVFTNTSMGDSLHCLWDFGDNTYDTSKNASKKYANAGNYNVTLMVEKNGIRYFHTQQIVVAPEPVISNIVIQGTASGLSYTYISSSTISSGNMTYMWSFGDSSSSTLINPVHTYKEAGTYAVTLDVVSDYGCTASRQYTAIATLNDTSVVVPAFASNNSKQCITNNSFMFNSSCDLSNISSFWWEFGDGSSSYEFSPIKTYKSAGTYIVKLSMVKNGITYTNEKKVVVGAAIKANYNEISLSNDGNYLFANTTVPYLSSTQYYWSFGDGCSSIDAHPIHQYHNGVYDAKLFVKDSLGCADSITKKLQINNTSIPNISASFLINKDTQCVSNNSFLFFNQSTIGCNIRYLWNFGDGTTSTEMHPQKIYHTAGTYNVSLTVSSGVFNNYFAKNIVLKNEAVWIGTSSNNWFDAANWMCNLPNDSIDIVIKKEALHSPNLNNQTIAINNLFVEIGATFSVSNSNITIKGNVANAGAVSASTSTFNFAGNKRQFIDGGFDIGKLISNNQMGVEILSTTGDSVNVYDVLILKQGLLITNNKLTLKSTASNTARLDKVGIDGNSGSIDGQVIVERYFQNKRGWRFITTPINANGNNTALSLNNTWQKYTNITGPSGVGFDFYSNFYQANYWSDSLNKWMNVKNTYNNYIASNEYQFANIPYFFFMRGDKTITSAYQSNAATISTAGFLQTGNQLKSFANKKKGNYVFVGNPYAAPVDLALITATGITGNFYVYDPTLNETGAYVTISNKGNGNWIITPASAQTDKILQSGQAVLVEVAEASGTIMFTENAKVSKNNMAVFGSGSAVSIDKLEVNLYKINSDNSKTLLDGAVTIFGDKYDKQIDINDSKKILNEKGNIGFQNGNDILSIEARPFVNGEDSISIFTSGLDDSTQYAIEIITTYNDSSLQQITLVDSLLNANATMALSGRSWYYFQPSSSNTAKRFGLYLKNNSNFEVVKINNLNAVQVAEKIKLTWATENAKDIVKYKIEHSIDGLNFVKIAYKNNCFYDDSLTRNAGTNFYRISALKNNDIAAASAIVETNFTEQQIEVFENYCSIFPNPNNGKFLVKFTSEAATPLVLNILDATSGKLIKTQFVNAAKGTNQVAIQLDDRTVANGLYIVSLEGEGTRYRAVKLVVNTK